MFIKGLENFILSIYLRFISDKWVIRYGSNEDRRNIEAINKEFAELKNIIPHISVVNRRKQNTLPQRMCSLTR